MGAVRKAGGPLSIKVGRMRLRVKLLDPSVGIPSQAYHGDAGYDLRSRIQIDLGPGERALVPTGIAIAIPEGHAGFVQPRSGLALHHGITCLNSPGLIDSKYRGELGVILINHDSEKTFSIAPGEKIAQLVIQKVESPVIEVVEELDDTSRGHGGFGSSGRK